MSERLTILFAPLDAHGHFNACIGLAEPLRDRGHRIIFAVPNGWKGKLEPMGFEEEWYSTEVAEDDELNKSATQSKAFNDLARGEVMSKPPHEQIKALLVYSTKVLISMAQNSEKSFKRIVAKVKPDVIVIDMTTSPPALITSGIPWILCLSQNPLAISKNNVPPAFSGLPTEGNRVEWLKFENSLTTELGEFHAKFKEWVIKHGAEPLQRNIPLYINPSPYANIYMCPNELDYSEYRQLSPKWHHFEALVRSSKENFEIPEALNNLPGRLVYFSMGSIGCSDVDLMKRLVGILGQSPHRFIVSKGNSGDQFELPKNMWGANMLPQTNVLPLVDLVITHGGNNTVTESFYFGKPCIVLPLFCDQHDNAQRIQETGLGFRFPPYHVTEDELLLAIENVLKNEELSTRMKMISKRIQASNVPSRTADLIERVARQI